MCKALLFAIIIAFVTNSPLAHLGMSTDDMGMSMSGMELNIKSDAGACATQCLLQGAAVPTEATLPIVFVFAVLVVLAVAVRMLRPAAAHLDVRWSDAIARIRLRRQLACVMLKN